MEAGKSSLSLGMDKRARDGYNAIKCEGKVVTQCSDEHVTHVTQRSRCFSGGSPS